MTILRLLGAAFIGVAAAAAHAQNASSAADHAAHHPAAASGTSAARPITDGEVRKIDQAQGKLTLKHGPIQNLDMPAMTMVFKVADPKMLQGLKEGDKVRFRAELVSGALTVMAIEQAAR